MGALAAQWAIAAKAHANERQSVPLATAFTYLDVYLATPAIQRSHFILAYVAMRGFRPAPDYKGVIVEPGGRRIPLALDRDARVETVPTLMQLRSDAVLEEEQDQRGHVRLVMEARSTVPATARPDPAGIEISLAEANNLVVSKAGILKMVTPKLDTAFFPDGVAGAAELADGSTVSLSAINTRSLGQVPYLEWTSNGFVKALSFAKAPSRILLGSRPKS